MEDIVDRLRVLNFKGPWQEAADEIERLRKALKQFCDSYQPHLSPERCQHCSEAYWEARAALKEGP
jgi:hypothetical protein